MFPNLAIAGAAKAGAVGAFLAPKAAQYGPRIIKVAKICGRFIVATTIFTVALDAAGRLWNKVPVWVKSMKARPRNSVAVTVKKIPRAILDTAEFLARSAVDGINSGIFWVTLPLQVALLLLGGICMFTIGLVGYGLTRVVTSSSDNSVQYSENVMYACGWPFFKMASLWSGIAYWFINKLRRFGQPELRFDLDLVAPAANAVDVTESTVVEVPKPAVPSNEKVVDAHIGVVFDPAAAADNPIVYGKKVRDQLMTQGGTEAVDAFRPLLKKAVQESGLQGNAAVRVYAGYDNRAEPVKPTAKKTTPTAKK